MLQAFSRVGMDTYAQLFGDADGDAFLVDGELIIKKENSYLITTNFRISDITEPPNPCIRYVIAKLALARAESFLIDLFRDILKQTAQKPPFPTLYSNIYDLKEGVVYLYQFQNFETPYLFDLREELREGFHY